MFRLYHNKKSGELRIEPVGTLSIDRSKSYDDIVSYNDCYFICNDRKKLKDRAEQLLEEWKQFHVDELNRLNDVKIKNKYK